MKLYQGESLALSLKPKDIADNIADYRVDVALVSEVSMSFCDNKHQRHLQAAIYWENINTEEGSADFTLTGEQTKDLHPGRYFLEIALYSKSVEDSTAKTQTAHIIEILPSYTK